MLVSNNWLFYGIDSFAFDGGNEQAKGARMLENANGQTTPIRSITVNAVHELTKAEYDSVVYAQNGRVDTHYLGITTKGKTRYFAVGNAALNYLGDWRNQRKILRAKYHLAYYGVLFVHMVFEMFGVETVPEEFTVMASRPPVLNTEEVNSTIVGILQQKPRWRVECCGRKVEFKVRHVQLIDEISGGAFNMVYTKNGSLNGTGLFGEKGEQTVLVDIGGGTVDLSVVDKHGHIVPGTSRSAELGIFEAMVGMKTDLDNSLPRLLREHPEYVIKEELFENIITTFKQSPSGMPLEAIYSILLDPNHQLPSAVWAGPTLNCYDIYENAMAPTIARLGHLLNQLAPGRNLLTSAPRAGVTGGAGILLYEELAQSILFPFADKDALFACVSREDFGQGVYANVFGMAKLLRAMERAERYEHDHIRV